MQFTWIWLYSMPGYYFLKDRDACMPEMTFLCLILSFLFWIFSALLSGFHHGLCHDYKVLQCIYHPQCQKHLEVFEGLICLFSGTCHLQMQQQMAILQICSCLVGMQKILDMMTSYPALGCAILT